MLAELCAEEAVFLPGILWCDVTTHRRREKIRTGWKITYFTVITIFTCFTYLYLFILPLVVSMAYISIPLGSIGINTIVAKNSYIYNFSQNLELYRSVSTICRNYEIKGLYDPYIYEQNLSRKQKYG